MRFALVVVLVAFFSGSALGAFFKSGNALHADCQSKIDTLNRAVCYGYIMGVVDSRPKDGKTAKILDWPYCVPGGVNGGQITDTVIKWLTNNPEKRHFVAASLIIAALSEAFPCK